MCYHDIKWTQECVSSLPQTSQRCFRFLPHFKEQIATLVRVRLGYEAVINKPVYLIHSMQVKFLPCSGYFLGQVGGSRGSCPMQSRGCWEKIPQAGELTNNKYLFLTVLEVQSSTSWCQQIWCGGWWEPPSWSIRWPCALISGQGTSDLSGILF